MTIDIREATRDDVEELARLRWQMHGERRVTAGEPSAQYLDGFAEWWVEQSGRTRAVVATDGDRVVGMGFLAVVPRVPAPGDLHRHHGDLQSLFVRPEQRGAGVGTRLVAAVVDMARQAGCGRIEVHSGSRAMPLYERSGFEHVARLMTQALDPEEPGASSGR